MTLETERLILREHTMEDLESHHLLLSDPEVMYYLPDLRTATLAESRINLEQAVEAAGDKDRRLLFLRMERKEDRDFVGEIGYTVEGSTPQGKRVGAGYFIHKRHRGQGYTPEALRELIRYAFQEDGVFRFCCGCLEENLPSRRTMEKAGLRREASLEQYQWHEGTWKDRALYRLLKREWEEEHGAGK